MPIIGDMRKREFRGRSWIYTEIINRKFPPDTEMVLHPEPPTNPKGRVILLHRQTVRKLRRVNPWRRGMFLMTTGQNRPNRL